MPASNVVNPVTLEDFAPDRLRPLRRAEYDRMVETGVFDEDERLELLRGLVVEMNPQKAPHSSAVQRLTEVLILATHGRAIVRGQLPLAISEDSEPEPDVAVVPAESYEEEHPRTAHLVIEVADTSLAKDWRVKGPIYAAAGVPEYWIVNLIAVEIEVYTEPEATGYRSVATRRGEDVIRLVAFPDVSIAVSQIVASKAAR